MNDPRYTDDEQAEQLKQWWKKNGSSIIWGVVIGVSLVGGINYWRSYEKSHAENASARFAQLLAADEDTDGLGSELISEYESTPYASLAALYSAKLSYEDGDKESAKSMLRWALNNTNQDAIKHVARLRLARVLVEEQALDEAKQLISVESFGGFESGYEELVGDIAMRNGDVATARDAYEKALSTLPQGSTFSTLLAMKLHRATGEAE